MIQTVAKLELLLEEGSKYMNDTFESEMCLKLSLEKWSKKEILGHLIDSGINNLMRFTEIQFEPKPFRIKKYNQNELVKANDYQNSRTKELIFLWHSINYRIMVIMKSQTENQLKYEIKFEDNTISNLRFLMEDYVDHLEHHLKQILKQ